MRIDKARAYAKLVFLLHRLDLIDLNVADKLIDAITVRCLRNPDHI